MFYNFNIEFLHIQYIIYICEFNLTFLKQLNPHPKQPNNKTKTYINYNYLITIYYN